MKDHTTNNPNAATLTKKELFRRFLDAPFYEGGNLSTLVDTRRVSETTFAERFEDTNSGLWPDVGYGFGGLHEFLLDELRNSDDPEYDLDEIVNDIAWMFRDFKDLKRSFDAVCTATRTEEPDEESMSEEAFDTAIREWEDNPRYVLPKGGEA